MSIDKIVNAINEYETKFDGWLKHGYSHTKDFFNDLIKEIKTNGTGEILEYYKTYSKSMNDSNSSWEKLKAIEDLMDLLEN